MTKVFLRLMALVFATVCSTAVLAQNYPTKPIKIVVPFPPGGATDIIGRAVAERLQAVFNRPVIVENKAGASGNIGVAEVVRSAPDGYTLHAPISTWAINVPLRPRLGYDPVTQLTRIMQTVRTPNVLVINQQKLPANDLPGVIAWLKRNGGNAAYSTSGIGSSDHLTMEMFKQVTGTDIAHVPYNGGSPATTALLSGDVQLSFQNLGSITPQIQSGRVKAILVTADRRTPLLPDVPTAAEAGLADFEVYSWQGLGGPAGITGELLQKIHAASAAALHRPEVVARMAETGFDIVASTPEAFARFQEGEIARWRRVIEAGRITAD